MKHVIIGTAGHIDHGKTTLIHALTGKDTDRLKEEQKRGISIDLGFTYFDLPSGRRAGIIDVPGHEKFIKNMLAGVIGIDIVLLVIAADEGVMPQTREHLAILDLIGIKKGFIVLTKTDLVDEEWIELVMDDIKENLKGTFLENSPIIPVSSTTGYGIDKVVELIDKMTDEVEERSIDDMPRLPIDRVFTISGFGTIVTGTLISGIFKLGDEVQIFPGSNISRIRSIQVHDEDTDIAYAGQRVAINLAGIKKPEVSRGDVLAPINSMKSTMMLDAKIKLIKGIDRSIENRTRLRLYIGTKEVLCRIILLDRDILNPGETCYAQIRLEESVVAKRGDRFILRFYSPMFTIGGGEVLEANPNKKKRFDERAIEELQIKEKGETVEVLEKIIKDMSRDFPSIKDISVHIAMSEKATANKINKLEEDGKIILFKLSKDTYVIHKEYFNILKNKILKELNEYHKKEPLKVGMSKEELKSRYLKNIKQRVSDSFIQFMIDEGYIQQKGESICISGFTVQLNSVQKDIKKDIYKIMHKNKFLPPKKEEVLESLNYDKRDIEQIFEYMVDSKIVIKIKEGIYLSKESYDESLIYLKEYIKKNGSINASEYRDLLGTNRKMAIALLEYFDSNKITKRIDDKRILF